MARYGKKASEKVEKAMHERKKGHPEEWPIQEESNQQKTGNRNWTLRGSEGGR